MIERVAILGTGLIGGSLGMVWNEDRPDLTIVGHDRPDVLETAEARGAINEKAADPLRAVADADLVVLATPVGSVLKLLDAIADELPDGAIVTDVASVKQPVLDQAEEVLPDSVTFIGGHPMAGAEDAGIQHADALLFENAVYALSLPGSSSRDVPVGDGSPGDSGKENGEENGEDTGGGAGHEAWTALVDLVEATGARPLAIDAATHDRVAAVVSHLPQLLAVALVNTVAETDASLAASEPAADPPSDRTGASNGSDDGDTESSDGGNPSRSLALELAAGGFRDITRIASSPFDTWRDILIGNEGSILDAVSHFTRSLQHLRNRLISEDLDDLEEAFDTARQTRNRIPRDQKGFLQPLSDVYVRAPDEPGVIQDFSTHLANAGLNIKDIELQRFREGTGGTFRLSFPSDDDAAEAVDVLSDAGYKARRPE